MTVVIYYCLKQQYTTLPREKAGTYAAAECVVLPWQSWQIVYSVFAVFKEIVIAWWTRKNVFLEDMGTDCSGLW
jgi:hypothetical protein